LTQKSCAALIVIAGLKRCGVISTQTAEEGRDAVIDGAINDNIIDDERSAEGSE
jgi:hypothetical protein